MSPTKIARLFGLLGLAVTPGGIVGLLHRCARAALPTYRALIAGVRNSAVVSPDETGWRVGGRGAWLWAFVGEGVTVYLIAAGRGFALRSPWGETTAGWSRAGPPWPRTRPSDT